MLSNLSFYALKQMRIILLENFIRALSCSLQLKLLEEAVSNKVNFAQTPGKSTIATSIS